MNTSNIKSVAPKARIAFIDAVTKRLNELGIYSNDNISSATEQGELLNIEGQYFDISIKPLRNALVAKVKSTGFTVLTENVAYTWFNRLCAIRYMELHDYLEHGFRVLSHPDKDNGFEILDRAQDVAEDLGLDRDEIVELKLAGNQDEQLYRALLLGQCHALHKAMPFLFEALDDETEILLPDNLTRTDSILHSLVYDIPAEDWEHVEVIGWLYQFYISEKKDEVMGKVVKSEDIPAATQLFTPNWIVKYLVQNSVGRQWLQTYPDSSIKAEMEYYIGPAEQTDEVNAQLKAITPESINPETITVLDPACGSGHILVETYKVLKLIYEERGYRSRDIPKLILENNLFGLDIDDRAAQLSGFALLMLGRADDRRIFTRDVQLNVVSMQSTAGIEFQNEDFLAIEVPDVRLVFIKNIEELLLIFKQAKTFGSLIDIPNGIASYLQTARNLINQLMDSNDLFAKSSAEALIPIIKQAEILSRKYDAVIANPPYMGGNGMNADLKKFAKNNYPRSKSDLFAIFMEHGFTLLKNNGFNSQINMHSWMFLSSFEKLRERLLGSKTCVTMAHLGARAFSEISGEVVQTTAWVMQNIHMGLYKPIVFRLVEGNEQQKEKMLIKKENGFSELCINDLKSSLFSSFCYWVPKNVLLLIKNSNRLESKATTIRGLYSGDNEKFIRYWAEVSINHINFDHKAGSKIENKWFPIAKGGGFRRWYGNNEFVVNWEHDGLAIKNCKNERGTLLSRPQNIEFYFKEGLSWCDVATGLFSARYQEPGYIYENAGPGLIPNDQSEIPYFFLLLNSSVFQYFLSIYLHGLHYSCGVVAKMPLIKVGNDIAQNLTQFNSLLNYSKQDWNSFENSFEFIVNPLISNNNSFVLKEIYKDVIKERSQIVKSMQKIEENNNQLFIEAFGLNNILSPSIPWSKISLLSNSSYRYGGNLSELEVGYRQQSDTISEFISYSIGCMMGRYSLDKKGLVYGQSGNEGFSELEMQGVYKTFPADDDGIIPLTDQDWFSDDATFRFREFVQVVWGEENLQENLGFVAESLCLHAIKPKNDESSLKIIRRYLSTQFYKDHLKTYKKRPIYWLFSSGKQKAFECLVYLHRYNEGTLARMRTAYVSPLLGKYDAYAEQLQKQIDDSASTAETNRLIKEQKALQKKQNELGEFDDKLKHYADMRISIDLDDGVKVNYGKFGDLLADVKAITGKK